MIYYKLGEMNQCYFQNIQIVANFTKLSAREAKRVTKNYNNSDSYQQSIVVMQFTNQAVSHAAISTFQKSILSIKSSIKSPI